MGRLALSVLTLFILSLAAAACAGETVVKEVPVEVVVEREVVREVPVEKIVTQEVVKTVEVPVEKIVTQEVIKEVMVPGETKVVEKEVVKEVPVEVVVEKEVVKEVVREVVVEKPVIREVIKEVFVERPVEFHEPQSSAQLVASGRLPPIRDRIPENPWVIPAQEIGRYGGEIRRGYLGPGDYWNFYRLSVNTSAGRWTSDGGGVIPAFAHKIETNDDGTQFTFHLREGARYSDGTPHTADDWEFMYNAVLSNREMIEKPPGWLSLGENMAEFEKLDDWTVRYTFQQPNFVFLNQIPQNDFGSQRFWIPGHYMQQFHPEYTDQAKIDQAMTEGDYDDWISLFQDKWEDRINPELPELKPWLAQNRWGDQRFTANRNPYYWAVDAAGNQLPYVDRLVYDLIENAEIINLRAIEGDIDVQARHMRISNYPLMVENADKGDYNVRLWREFGGTNVSTWFNQTYSGPEAELFNNEKFRQALSLGVDREQINEIVFLGTVIMRNYVPAAGHPHYPGADVEFKWIEFDPERANAMLDEIIPNKDSEGYRTLPNGDRLELSVILFDGWASWADTTELVLRQLDENVKIRGKMRVGQRNPIQTTWWGNEEMMFTHPFDTVDTFSANSKSKFTSGLAAGVEHSRWINTDGAEGLKPPDRMIELNQWHREGPGWPPDRAAAAAKEIYKYHAEQAFAINTAGLAPSPAIVKNNMRNVPDFLPVFWPLRTPNNGYPEVWFYAN